MVIISAVIKLFDTAYQELPMRDRLKEIVQGFFRVFDSNGDGVIEAFELNEIVTDVITGLANILVAMIDFLEPQLLKVTVPCSAFLSRSL